MSKRKGRDTTGNFSFDTVKDFDHHILLSVPDYGRMLESILVLADYFLDEDAAVYDAGCSTGKLLRALPFKGRKIGLDNSPNLLPGTGDGIEYIHHDLNKPFAFENACMVFSMFTLQFLKRGSRQGVIQRIYDGLNPGGALILTEKVYAADGVAQDMFTFAYYDFKKKSFTEKEILDKEISLRKILKPNTTRENLAMVRRAGFRRVEMFYKYFNFEGWLCLK